MNIQFQAPLGFEETTGKFSNAYHFAGSFNGISDNRNQLKMRPERICRYCGLKMPVVKFTSKAHLIPEMLGAKNLICDFECDDCNNVFSGYEDSFGKMLAPFRTLYEIQGKKNKIPKVKPINGRIEMQVKEFYGRNSLSISRALNSVNPFSINDAKGTLDINSDIDSYTTESVYKFFLKNALSLIPADEVKDQYDDALKFLLNKTKKRPYSGIVSGYHVKHYQFNPHVFLFKKKDELQPLFTHVIAYYALDKIFTFQVPLNNKDGWFDSSTTEVLSYPPLFVGKEVDCDKLVYDPFSIDMLNEGKLKGKLSMSLPNIKKVVRVNPATGQIVLGSDHELNIDDIQEILFVEEKLKLEKP